MAKFVNVKVNVKVVTIANSIEKCIATRHRVVMHFQLSFSSSKLRLYITTASRTHARKGACYERSQRII